MAGKEEPHRVNVGRGGCWYEGHVCDTKAISGGYYCKKHLPSRWNMSNVAVGGDTGKVLTDRGPDSDPDLEGGLGRVVY